MEWTLVTGGAKRLGAHLCYALAEQGYPVVVHYRHSQAEALAVVKQCQQIGVEAAAIQGDFSTPESVVDFTKRYLAQFPDTCHLINNVGNYLVKSALQTDMKDWMDLFQTNLHTPFILIKELLPSIARFQGHIINMGVSGMEGQRAHAYATAYSLTKGSLLMLTRSLAVELAPRDVRVNMISPGYLTISVDLPKNPQRLVSGRLAEPAEVGRVLTFLLDPQNGYLTGQNIEVAGGVGL